MEDLNVAIRLKGFIDAEGLTNSQFADKCGIPRPSLSQILSGRNKKISDVIVGQIHQAFPDLSVLWLLFGEGSMMTPKAKLSDSDDEELNLFTNVNDFAGNGADAKKYENLNALNSRSQSVKKTESEQIEVDLKIAELQRQIDKLRKNPRKVSQITVYYDDSTFETFYPRR